jgi:acetyl esterase/lipase
LTRKDKPSRFGCGCPAEEKLKTFRSAVEDIHDATTFLIRNREKFGLDPDKIILSGGSAGAEAVLNAAYEPWASDSLPIQYAGVVSFAGAMPDTVVITAETAIPSLLFHGTCDNLVPYATDPHHYCDKDSVGYLILSGSYSIAEKLKQLNKPYWLHTTCGGNHSLAATPMTAYFDEIMYFCYRFVVKGVNEQIRTVIPGDQNKCNYEKYGFCEK